LSKRGKAVLTTALGSVLVLVTLVGAPIVATQTYRGEIDFDYQNQFFGGNTSTTEAFVENLGYPFPYVNFTAEPTTDSVWGFSVTSRFPAAMRIENSSGVVSENFTRVSTIGIRNWEYFEVQDSVYWLNTTDHANPADLRISSDLRHAFPVLTITGSESSASVFTFATFRAAAPGSRIAVAGSDFEIERETSSAVNISGRARLSFEAFDFAYFWLTTSRHAFLLQPGARLLWFDSQLTFKDASGSVTSSNGDEARFFNATISTRDTPRRGVLEVIAFPGNALRIVVQFELEATVLAVMTPQGGSIVGSRSDDIFPISWWPGKWLNAIVVIAITIALMFLSWVKPESNT